jgi:hypothetical protein
LKLERALCKVNYRAQCIWPHGFSQMPLHLTGLFSRALRINVPLIFRDRVALAKALVKANLLVCYYQLRLCRIWSRNAENSSVVFCSLFYSQFCTAVFRTGFFHRFFRHCSGTFCILLQKNN